MSDAEGKSGCFGLTIKQELGKFFSLETGFALKNYNFGFTATVNNRASFSYSTLALRTLQVPLVLNAKFGLGESNIFLVPNIGYIMGFNPAGFNVESGVGYSYYTQNYLFLSDQDVMTYTVNLKPTTQKTINLVRLGLNLEFIILKKLHLDINLAYTFSSNQMLSGAVTYHLNNPYQMINNPLTISGNYSSVGVTLSYPVNLVGDDKEEVEDKLIELGW